VKKMTAAFFAAFSLFSTVLLAPAAGATPPPLTWTRHSLPLSGELVLTDVHAIAEGGRVVALATGEGGVVLKLDAPAAQAKGVWTTLLDTSFPTYWYGCYVFSPSSLLVSGFIDGDGAAYGVVAFSDDGGASWGNDTKIDPCGGAVCAWGGGPIEFANATEGYMPSTSGQSAWRTQQGGRNASEWVEIVPSPAHKLGTHRAWTAQSPARARAASSVAARSSRPSPGGCTCPRTAARPSRRRARCRPRSRFAACRSWPPPPAEEHPRPT